jgi:hypothetical protein
LAKLKKNNARNCRMRMISIITHLATAVIERRRRRGIAW